MAIITQQPDQRFVLHGVSWQSYEKLLDALGDQRTRHAYDGWNLELVSPSMYQQWIRKMLARLLEAAALELAIPIRCIGSTTLRRKDVEKGIEPDEAYYVRNSTRVRGKIELDSESFASPDLAIEVGASSSSVDRLKIYALLGVPEVWRFSEGKLTFLEKHSTGYRILPASRAFPYLKASDLMPFLTPSETCDDTSVVRSFLDGLRARPYLCLS